MNDDELLRRELRVAREELVHKRARQSGDQPLCEGHLPLMPERDEAFLRLALMSVEDLEAHTDRLERELVDFEDGIDWPDADIE